MTDETNAAEHINASLRNRLAYLDTLHLVVDGDADQADETTLGELDIGAEYDDHELQSEPSEEDAQEALNSFALGVETTTLHEIVLGTGGPDDRLIVEVDQGVVRRIRYRYSWSGSAERTLSGGDYRTALRFACHLIPELED